MRSEGEQLGALCGGSGKRRVLLDLVLLLCGVLGLVTLYRYSDHPRLRQALWALVAWQSFWYAIRLYMMIGIWRREHALTAARKLWLGLTMPIPGIAAIWAGRGALSDWLTQSEENAS